MADIPYALLLGESMKNAGVFLGGLGSVLACNLMLIGVCSSAPTRTMPAPAVPPPPPPLPVVIIIPKPVAPVAPDPSPLGLFLWGCGSHRMIDSEGALPLPICAPLLKL